MFDYRMIVVPDDFVGKTNYEVEFLNERDFRRVLLQSIIRVCHTLLDTDPTIHIYQKDMAWRRLYSFFCALRSIEPSFRSRWHNPQYNQRAVYLFDVVARTFKTREKNYGKTNSR